MPLPFASPLWLLALLPWAALGAWLLTGAGRRAAVPFLPLWQREAGRPPRRRRMRPPPAYASVALLAGTLAILAAARPTTATHNPPPVVVVLDRGATMSALDAGVPRYLAAARRLATTIPPATPVELIDALTGERAAPSTDALRRVDFVRRTALPSGPAVERAVREALARADGPIYVLSDRPPTDARAHLVAPPHELGGIGIDALTVRDGAKPQAMVVLRNRGPARRVNLTVTSGAHTDARLINLPAVGRASAFFDLHAGDRVEARVAGSDDPDAAAFALRQPAKPTIDVRPGVSEPLRRMAKVYAPRPARLETSVIALATNQADLNGDPGAIEAPPSLEAVGDLTVVTDPLTAVVDWHRVTRAGRVAAAPVGDGWETLVAVAGKPVVARHLAPARQVWVGTDESAWSRQPDYVVFWANAFQWLGGDGAAWASRPIEALPSGWMATGPTPDGDDPRAWPGFFRDAAGTPLAMSAVPGNATLVAGNDVTLAPAHPGQRPWSGAIALTALACTAAAAARWPARR